MFKSIKINILTVLLLMSSPLVLWAQEGQIDKSDTAWMLVSCALVLLMTPGLALFYGGMVRSKNVLSTLMHSVFAMGLMTLHWVIIGYSLAFGEDHWGFIGGLNHFMLNGVGTEPYGTIPHIVFMLFQGMFAIITPALISGAIAERMKFSTYCVFILLWATLVYDPICHWVWGAGGWLLEMEALDFAGGTVVHMSSGFSALVIALVLGSRIGFGKVALYPNNLVFTAFGAGLLWFGWYGFNAGSALSVGSSAAMAFATTHIAAAAGLVAWVCAEWFNTKKPSVLGAASGLVAGLVVITPAAGFVSPMSALIMGAIGGVVCYCAVLLKHKFHYDDSLDAFGVHGVGGMLGALLVGVFAAEAFGGKSGLIEGNLDVLGVQFISVIATMVYAGGMTWLIIKFLDLTMGLRVDEHEEREGLDINQHGEHAYTIQEKF